MDSPTIPTTRHPIPQLQCDCINYIKQSSNNSYSPIHDATSSNARQLVRLTQPTSITPTSLPTLPHVYGLAPTALNSFSDGSVALPNLPSFALVSCGIWYPGRSILEHPITDLEADYTFNKQNLIDEATHSALTGIAKFAIRSSMSTSSSRVELLGLINALLLQKPIHSGIDSKVVKDTAERIIVNPLATPHRPYAIMNDGDLWKVFRDL